MNSASGDCVRARLPNRFAYCVSNRSRKSTIPMMSLRMGSCSCGWKDAAPSAVHGTAAHPRPCGSGVRASAEIFRKSMKLLERAIEKLQFPAQCGLARLRQVAQEVLDHRAQAPCHLEVFRAVLAYLAESELHEIIPGRRPEYQPDAPVAGVYLLLAQMPLAHCAQESVKLVDSQYGRGRIVDRLRQRLDRDVDDDADRKRRSPVRWCVRDRTRPAHAECGRRAR